MQVTTVGIDLAKNVVQVRGVDRLGHVGHAKDRSPSRSCRFPPSYCRAWSGSKPREVPISGTAS